VVVLAVAAVAVAAIAWGALDAARAVRSLDDGWRRYRALGTEERRRQPLIWVGNDIDAFVRFGAALDAGDRFAVVVGPRREQDRALYGTMARFYFYPAVGSDPDRADYVVGFGGATPPPGARAVVRVGDAWLVARTVR
jgi:hypothetical protein